MICFARKRTCIKTSQEDNILERFKIIACGKVFILRAKELFVWSPSFKAAKEADYCSDEDVNKDATNNIEDDGNYVNGDAESDVECVSDTVLADQEEHMGHVLPPPQMAFSKKEVSSDPFNLNDLINRHWNVEAQGDASANSRFIMSYQGPQFVMYGGCSTHIMLIDAPKWDFLDACCVAFGFGSKWRLWIRGSLYSGMASVLLNGSPSLEFEFHRGLKQGDPLALYPRYTLINGIIPPIRFQGQVD
ncbi:hypothetical protein Tco_0471672 [Tanacetum coccineum]